MVELLSRLTAGPKSPSVMRISPAGLATGLRRPLVRYDGGGCFGVVFAGQTCPFWAFSEEAWDPFNRESGAVTAAADPGNPGYQLNVPDGDICRMSTNKSARIRASRGSM
jgi:hypothetical protein